MIYVIMGFYYCIDHQSWSIMITNNGRWLTPIDIGNIGICSPQKWRWQALIFRNQPCLSCLKSSKALCLRLYNAVLYTSFLDVSRHLFTTTLRAYSYCYCWMESLRKTVLERTSAEAMRKADKKTKMKLSHAAVTLAISRPLAKTSRLGGKGFERLPVKTTTATYPQHHIVVDVATCVKQGHHGGTCSPRFTPPICTHQQ